MTRGFWLELGRSASRTARAWPKWAPASLGLGCVLTCIWLALAPAFADLSLYGGHDWDEMSAHRLLTVKALLEFRQLPLWMPYACGGFSEWGNVQGASNLISPWLPAYLLLELRHALRVELLGTALVSALGTWLLAGEFSRSVAARVLACLVFVVNGRFALQAATGHLWHLQYCYLPWVFWAFERALRRDEASGSRAWVFELRWLVVGASALAMLVYSGGIYPLPHAAVLLSVYGLARAGVSRSLRPLWLVAIFGLLAIGLSAPKLFAVMTDFGERPRLVPSPESIDLPLLWQALTALAQTPGSRPVPISHWGWHEYGLYMGWLPALLLGLGLVWPAPPREQALKLTGLVALVLGFGAFSELSPWALLHQVSIFRSQHVPTRWLYPAVLCLGIVAAAFVGRVVAKLAARWPRLDVLLLGPCLWLAVDVGQQASVSLRRAFWMQARSMAKAPAFVQVERVPRDLQYRRRDYAPEALPAVLAGIGVLQCTLHASLNIWAPKAENGRPFGQGARGQGHKQYRGEVFTLGGSGQARLVSFSPNRVEVEVSGARAGERLVLNQNFDPGWSVNGRAAEVYQDALATTLTPQARRLVFTFWPRGLSAGLASFALTLVVLGGVAYLRRAKAATLSP